MPERVPFETNQEDLLPLAQDPSEETPERLEQQVQRAQEQLVLLRRQQELIERQKRQLEELSRKQEELDRGRREMTECLSRAVVTLDRESYESERRLENLRGSRDIFAQHLAILERIDPASWDDEALQGELNRALASVDHARTEYDRHRAKLGNEGIEPGAIEPTQGLFEENPSSHEFWRYFRNGLAFTLPLLILGAIALALVLLNFGPGAR